MEHPTLIKISYLRVGDGCGGSDPDDVVCAGRQLADLRLVLVCVGQRATGGRANTPHALAVRVLASVVNKVACTSQQEISLAPSC